MKYSQGIKGIRVVAVEMRVPIVCKIGSLSRAEGDIDIDLAKRNYYTVHLFHINTCIFTRTEDIELAISTSL